jgi:hypothetical protein
LTAAIWAKHDGLPVEVRTPKTDNELCETHGFGCAVYQPRRELPASAGAIHVTVYMVIKIAYRVKIGLTFLLHFLTIKIPQ